MMSSTLPRRPVRRILVVDDNPEIHNLLRAVLLPPDARQSELEHELADLESELFGTTKSGGDDLLRDMGFSLESAHQGDEAVEKAKELGPGGFFLAFVDMRMPPGIDGVETIRRLWRVDPDLYCVICSAYSDYGWEEITAKLGSSSNLLVLRKPFEAIEVRQIAAAIARMYDALANVRETIAGLEAQIEQYGVPRAQAEQPATDCAGLAVLRVDQNGVVSGVSLAAKDLFGAAPSDLVGVRVSDIVRHRALALEDVRDGLTTRGMAVPRAGAEIEVALTVAPLPAGSEPPREWLYICQPITVGGRAAAPAAGA